jgi:hypothetical protein
MFYFCPMRIPSALRRKQDEIVATIARYEARIEAARMDLAALNQVARLFDPEIGRDETQRNARGSESSKIPLQRNAKSGSRSDRSPRGQLALPATHVARGQIREEFFT